MVGQISSVIVSVLTAVIRTHGPTRRCDQSAKTARVFGRIIDLVKPVAVGRKNKRLSLAVVRLSPQLQRNPDPCESTKAIHNMRLMSILPPANLQQTAKMADVDARVEGLDKAT